MSDCNGHDPSCYDVSNYGPCTQCGLPQDEVLMQHIAQLEQRLKVVRDAVQPNDAGPEFICLGENPEDDRDFDQSAPTDEQTPAVTDEQIVVFARAFIEKQSEGWGEDVVTADVRAFMETLDEHGYTLCRRLGTMPATADDDIQNKLHAEYERWLRHDTKARTAAEICAFEAGTKAAIAALQGEKS